MTAASKTMLSARGLAWFVLASALGAGGCGSDSGPMLVDYLDELSVDMPLETASYVSLGEFRIPIMATPAVESPDEAPPAAVPMMLEFELTAETLPPHEKAVEAVAALRRGAMSDAVLTVVRTSTFEELTDPRLSAVKARLTDYARPLLGENLVRQLVLNELQQESESAASSHEGHGGGHGTKKEDSHGGGHH